jgi:hypothetical protein
MMGRVQGLGFGLLVSPPMRRFVGIRLSPSEVKRGSLGITSGGFYLAGKSFGREVRWRKTKRHRGREANTPEHWPSSIQPYSPVA